MVGQAVGATGESPKDDRQDAGPTQDARCHQILLLFAITFENLYNSGKAAAAIEQQELRPAQRALRYWSLTSLYQTDSAGFGPMVSHGYGDLRGGIVDSIEADLFSIILLISFLKPGNVNINDCMKTRSPKVPMRTADETNIPKHLAAQ
jgi:hypothetical protein